MANWPSTLPQSLLVDSYAEEQESGVVRTQMDAGPANVRRRFTAVSTNVTGSMALTDAQWVTLMTFYNTTLGAGSLSFSWHPRGLHLASPTVIYTMRFIAPPTRRALKSDSVWDVGLSFEVLP